MTKKIQKTPNTTLLVLAVIASCLVAILLYVGLHLFFDYLEHGSADDTVKLLLIVGFMFVAILGPGLLVAAIVAPILKKK